jgi:hypothetical protein
MKNFFERINLFKVTFYLILAFHVWMLINYYADKDAWLWSNYSWHGISILIQTILWLACMRYNKWAFFLYIIIGISGVAFLMLDSKHLLLNTFLYATHPINFLFTTVLLLNFKYFFKAQTTE